MPASLCYSTVLLSLRQQPARTPRGLPMYLDVPLQLLVPRLDPGGLLDGCHLAVELVDVREALRAAGLRRGDLFLRRYPG